MASCVAYLPSIAAFALLVTLATLLSSIGLENALNVSIGFDRELRAQGVAVIASAVAGGFVGNTSVGSTTAAVASGARGRLTGIMSGIAAVVFLFAGWPLLPFIPKFIVAGLLLEIGAAIVWRWCWRTRLEMPPGEWALVIAIVVLTVWVGLVPAIPRRHRRRLHPFRARSQPRRHRASRLWARRAGVDAGALGR